MFYLGFKLSVENGENGEEEKNMVHVSMAFIVAFFKSRPRCGALKSNN